MPGLLAILIAGCAPNDAEVTGSWYTWLASSSSLSVQNDLLDLSDATRIDCARGWNETIDDWDPGYIGPRTSDEYQSDQFLGGACAPDAGSECPAEELAETCSEIGSFQVHDFLAQDGYYAFNGDINPTRTEALINSEGHFQLTVHHDLGTSEDFRFHFSIDQDFAPVVCTSDENGETVIEYIDGANWIDEWSEDVDGTLYYLNAAAYQVNPAEPSDRWFLDVNWLAGYGHAKFGDDLMNSETVRYGIYSAEEFLSGDSVGDPFVIGSVITGSVNHEQFDPENDDHIASYQAEADQVRAWAFDGEDVDGDGEIDLLAWEDELGTVGGGEGFEHKVEDNTWRPVDGTQVGLDGWMELHSSWVRIDDGSVIDVDGQVSGDYQILYKGTQSNSRVLVRGEFSTNKIHEDRWGYDDLSESKREENGSPFCGGLSLPD